MYFKFVNFFKPGDAVLYMNLDGGGGGEACPSIADSSAVSLSQMAFLSMTVSIFSVVARYYSSYEILLKKHVFLME